MDCKKVMIDMGFICSKDCISCNKEIKLISSLIDNILKDKSKEFKNEVELKAIINKLENKGYIIINFNGYEIEYLDRNMNIGKIIF